MKRSSIVLALMMTSATALADIPPPAGYVESCTAVIQARGRDGRECRDCNTYHGNPPTYCSDQVGAGFTKVCRSRGSSAWNEVWCRDSAEAPAVAAEPAVTATPVPAMEEAPAPAMNDVTVSTNTTPAPAPAAPRSREGCALGHAHGSAATPLVLLFGLLFASHARKRRAGR